MRHSKYIKGQDGFSLVELLIVMALFVIVLAISSDTFTLILRQSAQQSKTAETQMERIVGIELLRTDIEHAGYGLPWSYPTTLGSYTETDSTTVCGGAGTDPSSYNDSSSNPPRAILSGNNTCYNGSDYIVIKATNVARSDTAQRWSYIVTGSNPKTWGSDNIGDDERVIVIKPKAGETTLRQLVMSGSTFFTTYSSTSFSSSFSPSEPSEMFLIYGIDPDTNLTKPFNRADYYITTTNVPSGCAPNTGVLRKAIVTQTNGTFPAANLLPILDCVADMQVIYRRDTDGDGTAENTTDTLAGLTAQQIREQVKEVRVYILTHEGQRDTGYTYPSTTITVGEFGLGSNFDVSAQRNYRWKVITLVVKPKNLQ